MGLRYIKEAARNVGGALALQQNYHVVVIKSTVVPTTTEDIVIPILEKYSGKKAGQFGVCMNPTMKLKGNLRGILVFDLFMLRKRIRS